MNTSQQDLDNIGLGSLPPSTRFNICPEQDGFIDVVIDGQVFCTVKGDTDDVPVMEIIERLWAEERQGPNRKRSQRQNRGTEVVLLGDVCYAIIPTNGGKPFTLVKCEDTEDADDIDDIKDWIRGLELDVAMDGIRADKRKVIAARRPKKPNWFEAYSSSRWIEPDSPIPDLPEVTVEPYGDRAWAVMMDGGLLCVTAYKRGALAVKRVITEMGRRYVLQREQLAAEQAGSARDTCRVLAPGI